MQEFAFEPAKNLIYSAGRIERIAIDFWRPRKLIINKRRFGGAQMGGGVLMRSCCSYSLQLVLACIVVGQYALVKVVTCIIVLQYIIIWKHCAIVTIVVSHSHTISWTTFRRLSVVSFRWWDSRCGPELLTTLPIIILTLTTPSLAIIGRYVR